MPKGKEVDQGRYGRSKVESRITKDLINDKNLDKTGWLERSHAAQKIHIPYTYEEVIEIQISKKLFSPSGCPIYQLPLPYISSDFGHFLSFPTITILNMFIVVAWIL